MPGMEVFVISRTLRKEDNPNVRIVDDPQGVMGELRSTPGKDVWLFRGGSLFRSFAELGLVDTVEVAVIPVFLGEGVPLLPPPAKRVALKLTGHKLYAKTGIVSLEYTVQHGRGSKRPHRSAREGGSHGQLRTSPRRRRRRGPGSGGDAASGVPPTGRTARQRRTRPHR
jgi:hypothetical protein